VGMMASYAGDIVLGMISSLPRRHRHGHDISYAGDIVVGMMASYTGDIVAAMISLTQEAPSWARWRLGRKGIRSHPSGAGPMQEASLGTIIAPAWETSITSSGTSPRRGRPVPSPRAPSPLP